MHGAHVAPFKKPIKKQTNHFSSDSTIASAHRKTAETNLPPHMIARVISDRGSVIGDRIWNGSGRDGGCEGEAQNVA